MTRPVQPSDPAPEAEQPDVRQPDDEQLDTGRPGVPRRARLRAAMASDNTRAWVAVGLGVLLAIVSAIAVTVPLDLDPYRAGVLGALLSVAGLCVAHGALTVWAFSGLEGGRLNEALLPSPHAHEAGRARGSGAASWTVQLSVLSLVVGAALARGWADETVFVVVGIAVVVGAWLSVIPAYAVHYGRLDAAHEADGRDGAFAAPGDGLRTFSDYLALASAVSTTFSSGDVAATSTPARRAVAGHGLLAFMFNAVVVALLVAVIVAAGR